MVRRIQRVFGRIEIRLSLLLLLICSIGSIVIAAVQFSKTADEPEFPIIDTWQELIEEYLSFRDSSYPLIPPDGVLSADGGVNPDKNWRFKNG